MKKPIARVSDHALLRYLQRVREMPVEALRDELGRRIDEAVRLGGCTAVVIDGFRFALSDEVVATVTEANPRDPRRGPKRRRTWTDDRGD